MPEQTRKLAAIVFTDIVGFTKLSAGNEPAALALLEKQRDLLKPIVEKHGGSWLKEIGDGLLLSFETTKDAVDCAIEIQKIVKEVENLNLRIGIHQGEVVFQGNDVIGDDVNIAARIEPFAAPGGIAISGRVNASLERDPDFETHYLGQPQLKGVSQTVKAYCITSHGLPKTDMSKVSAKLEPEGFQWNVKNTIGIAASMIGLFMLINFMFLRIGYADKDETPSIAILPFENKGEEADEFYAYGISSDLIADVTSAGLIRVASLKDIEKLDYNNLENNELAKKLLVRYVAQGTLWKVDTLFQLSLEIFDTKLSKVIYTKRWETAWKDLAVIKDDLSDNILETLEIEVLQDVELARKINPDAYEYYLKGKYKYEKRKTLEDKNIAVQLLEKAVELDENFLGAKSIFASIAKDEGDSEKAIEITLNVLDQAEKIDDNKIIKKCLNNLGFYYNNSGQYEKAEPYLLRLIEIAEEQNDNYWLGWGYGNLSVTVLFGNNNNIKEIERAEEYNAKAFSLYKNSDSKRRVAPNREFRGYIYRYKGDYDMALNYYHQSHEMFLELDNTTRIWSNMLQLGKTYNLKGDYNKALDYFGRSLKIAEKLEEKSWIAWTLNNLGKIYFMQGEYEKSVKYLERSAKLMQEQKKDDYEQDLDVMCYLYLSYKALGEQYDESEIRSLIKEEEKEDFDYQFNFALYQILEDSSYLEAAYTTIKEITAWMDDEMKEKFLNYPIPKAITDKYNSVST